MQSICFSRQSRDDRQALVGIAHPAPHGRPEEPDYDPRPVAPVEEEQGRGGPEVQDREHGDERRAGLPEVEPDERGDDHRVAERRHRKEFGDSLERGKKEICLRTLEVVALAFDLTPAQLLSRL